MARSINDIQTSILEAKNTATELDALQVLTDSEQTDLADNLSTTSKVSVWRLFVWIVAFGIWVHEQLMEVLKADIEKRIAETRPFTRDWYKTTSLNYQHGFPLPESGVYAFPETPQEAQAINASKIINKAAVVQQVINGVGALRIKVATLTAGELGPVPLAVLVGFQEYIALKGAAGISVVATTGFADDLKLELDVHFNALILDNEGKRLDGTNDTPVQSAITNYLKSVDFNGVLDLIKLSNVIEAVDGVISPYITVASSKYASFNYDTVGFTNAGMFKKFRQPDSGYLKLDEAESVFNFIQY